MRPDVICLTNGQFQENCYIVSDSDAKLAVLIDPGEEAELFLRRIASENLELTAVWLTHAHVDHVLGVGQVVAQTDVPVYLHPADRALYDRVVRQAEWLGVQANELPAPDYEIAHGDLMQLGEFSFEVRHAPGHSPGGVAFVGHGLALVGDALFAGSIGRTDLPGGDAETLMNSIRTQLLTLPDDTVVHAGHGPATTIGVERRSNPFLTGAYRLV